MIKGFLIGLVLAALAPAAHAMGSHPSFEVGYSSFATKGVICTTGTVVQINATRPTGFTANIAGYRIKNQDSSESVWLGGPTVSTTSVSAAQLAVLGEQVEASGSSVWHIGKDPSISGVPVIKLYCRAEDAAGAAGAVLSLVWFGY